jgi:hypothetical protein
LAKSVITAPKKIDAAKLASIHHTMYLPVIRYVSSISGRKELLQKFLKEHPIGELTDDEDKILKYVFQEYYIPDPGQEKYPIEDIDRFYIGYGQYNTICFHMRLKNGQDDVATLKRLSGENRTQHQNLHRALRTAINSQIEDFKNLYTLDPTRLCPIESIPLGTDAQVDHHNPTFKELVEEWMKENPNPKIKWGPTGSSIYLLEEPYHTSWVTFHHEKAELRWLSKEGNKKAHRC